MKQSSFLKNIALRFIFTIPLRFSGLIILPLLTRLYTKEIYAAWLQVIVVSEMLSNILGLQIAAAIVRYISGENNPKQKIKAAFTVTIACSLCFVATSLIFGNGIAKIIFGNEELKSVLLVASLWISLKALMRIGLSVLRAQEKIGTLSSREFVSTLWLICAVFGAYLTGLGIEILIIICLVGDTILLIWILFQIEVPFPFIRITRSIPEIKKYFPFSIPLILGTLFLWFTRSIDRFLIVHILGLDSAGVYGVSLQVSNLLSVALNPINFVLFPRVSESWNRKNDEDVNYFFSKAVTLTLILSAPIIVGIFVISEGLVPMLAGQGYATSKGLIGFLLLSGLAGMIYQNHLYIINLIEKTYLLPILFITTAALNYIFCYFFINNFGIEGAAFARFLTSMIMAIIVTLWARKYVKFTVAWEMIFKVSIISSIMGVSIFWLPMNTWYQLLKLVTLGILEFILLLFAFKVLTLKRILLLRKSFIFF